MAEEEMGYEGTLPMPTASEKNVAKVPECHSPISITILSGFLKHDFKSGKCMSPVDETSLREMG